MQASRSGRPRIPATPGTLAFGALIRAHAALVARLDQDLQRHHRLSLSDFEVLLRLGSAPGRRLRMAVLARGAFMSPSGLTRLVQRLEADGLLVRERDPEDGRGAWAVLTPAGQARLDAAARDHFATLDAAFEVIPPADLAALTSTLQVLASPDEASC